MKLARSINYSVSVLVLSVGAMMGCAHEPTSNSPDANPLRQMAIVFRTFPERPGDRSIDRVTVDPDPNAPPCAFTIPQLTDGRPVRAATSSKYVGGLSLTLPRGYAVRATVAIMASHGDQVLDGEPGLLGIWQDTTWVRERAPQWDARISMESGFSQMGADTSYRQANEVECVSELPTPGTRVLWISLPGPKGRIEYVVAVWPLAPGRF